MRHYPRCLPHEFANGPWQAHSTRAQRLLTMASLVVAHGLDDGATAQVTTWQTIQVALQVTFDLSLRFGHETEAGLVSQQRGERADAEGTGIPKGLQQTGSTAQFLQPRLAPCEVIGLFARGVQHELPYFRVPGEHGLSVIEGLGGYLAGVVDAHQRRGFAPVFAGQVGIGLLSLPCRGRRAGGRGTAGRRGRQQGAQRTVCGRYKGIQGRASRHGEGL